MTEYIPGIRESGRQSGYFSGHNGGSGVDGALLGTPECPFTALIVRLCNSVTR